MRYQAALSVVAAAFAFAGAAVFVSLWLFLTDFVPPGAAPQGALASLTLTQPARRPGVPAGLLERASRLRGVSAAYGARPTAFSVGRDGERVEWSGAFVSRDFFSALGVPLDGAGFSFRQPWQRNLPRECVLSKAGAQRLFGGTSAVGQQIQLNGKACQVVAVVKGRFSGLRPPRRDEVWLSWPSMLGLGVPEVAPDDFLEETFLAREAGLLLSGERSLHAVESALRALYAEQFGDTAQLRLRVGDGLDPGERERAAAEMHLLFLASATLLLVVGCLLTSAAAWRAERQRGELSTRLALGATRERLVAAAAWRPMRFFALALLAGALIAHVGYRALIGLLDLGPLTGVLPLWPSLRALGVAGAVLFGFAVLSGLAEARVVLSAREGALWSQIQAARRTRVVEWMATAFVLAVVAFALLLSLGLAFEQRRLAAVDMGWSNPAALVHSFERPTTVAQAELFEAPEARPDAFLADLEARYGPGRVALASSVPYRPVPVSWPVAPPPGEADRGPLQFAFNTVTASFFAVIGARFIEGGVFAAGSDDLVLDASAATRLLGPPPWVGQTVRLRGAMGDSEHRVSGVVADLRIQGRSEDPEAYIYRPLDTLSQVFHVLVDPEVDSPDSTSLASIAEAHGLRAPLRPPTTLAAEQAQDERFARFRAWLVLGACVMTVLLGALGLYATLAAAVSRRLHELAVRSALGATAPRLLRLVGRRFAWLVPAGLALGSLAFVALSRTVLASSRAAEQLPSMAWVSVVLAMVLVAALSALPVFLRLRSLAPARLLASE